jgi:hypothetical protein
MSQSARRPATLEDFWAIPEVISQANATDDTVKKLRLYHRAAIPHYWLVDPRDATMTVMRWSEDGYITLLRAERGETVRAEPFDAIEFAVGARSVTTRRANSFSPPVHAGNFRGARADRAGPAHQNQSKSSFARRPAQ